MAELEIFTHWKDINDTEDSYYTGMAIDRPLNLGEYGFDEQNMSLVNRDRLLKQEATLSAGIHGLTVGISSPEPWKVSLKVRDKQSRGEPYTLAEGKVDNKQSLQVVMLVMPRLLFREMGVRTLRIPSAGFIIGARKTGYSHGDLEEAELSQPAPRPVGETSETEEETESEETSEGESEERIIRGGV